jgi:hypothetical protein
MKRTFNWNFESVVPIMDFDFRVTVVALQAVRGYILEKNPGPESLSADQRILANFLDLPITPDFLEVGSDFNPYENRYSAKITEMTGFPSNSKNFQSDGKTLRDFAHHRLGTSIAGALFLCLMNFNADGRATIPSLGEEGDMMTHLNKTVSATDLQGIRKGMEIILNPQLELGSKIIKMNPTVEQEFPNIGLLTHESAVGKTFLDLVADAVVPVAREQVTV